MNNQYNDPFNFESLNNDSDGKTSELKSPETASGVSASKQADYSSPTQSEPKPFENLYSDSAYKKQTEGYASPAQTEYKNSYSVGAQSSSSAPYTERTVYSGQQNNSFDNGYYHRSFTKNPSGNNVNYTAPSAPRYAQPNPQPQPNSPERVKKERNGMSKGGIALLLVVCILFSGAAGFGGSLIAQNMNKQQYDTTSADSMVIHKVNTEVQPAGTESVVDKSTSQITSEVADTVVEITTESMQTSSFYGQYIAKGAGSGVIISNDGYIITNNHVIDGATSIKVTTRDGDSYDATLIGTDDEVDIALIKIDATDLPAAVFGDSGKLNVGDKAVIIGNPLGTLGGSVTEGIISALDRSIVIDGTTMHLMQTDAAINPGNSGGGMFNGQGELSGIVVAKSSSSGSDSTIDNIGFVIPINTVLDILGDLKDHGYVRGRAYTGMSFIDLTNQMYAWYYYRNSEAGVYISNVESGSNAEKAGFRVGDRVVSVDGHTITSSSEIDTAISEKSVGDKVTFVLDRGGSSGTLELTLEEEVPKTTGNKKSSDTDTNSGLYDLFR